MGLGPSVEINFLWGWIVGLGPGELAQGPNEWLCSGSTGFSYAFSEIRQKRLKSLNIRNACGARLEKRSFHPPPVPARDLEKLTRKPELVSNMKLHLVHKCVRNITIQIESWPVARPTCAIRFTQELHSRLGCDAKTVPISCSARAPSSHPSSYNDIFT